MMKLNNPKTALVYAVDLLAVRSYSVNQLKAKLKRRDYSDEEIELTIAKLLQKHYLDDTDLCKRQCNAYFNEKKRSIKAIRYKLMEKGFNSDDIEEAFDDLAIDTVDYEYKVCLKLLSSHFKVNSVDKQKYYAYLYRKGFSSSSIRVAIEDFCLA